MKAKLHSERILKESKVSFIQAKDFKLYCVLSFKKLCNRSITKLKVIKELVLRLKESIGIQLSN